MRIRILLLAACWLIPAASATGAEIHQAAEAGDLATVRSLLEANRERLNARDEAGYTPLHEAAYAGHLDVLRYLLSLGADYDATSTSGSTPLHGAAYYGHADAVEMLIAGGAAVDVVNAGGYTPLLSACAGGRADAATRLIAGGADVNVALEDGTTPLHQALWNNSAPLVEALVGAGANVDAQNAEGISPLYFAVAYRDAGLSRTMLDKGRVWDLRGRYGLTMLHYAAARGQGPVVQTLIEQGIDLNAQCLNGRTAYDYAVLWGHDEIAELLQDAGAKTSGPVWGDFRGEFLGQKRPGRTPIPFAENKLITPFAPHGAMAWSPDGEELFWCHQAMPIQAVWYTKQVNGVWQRPVIAPFAEPELDYFDGHPSFSADGRRVYFHSHRPLVAGGERKEDADIWYVERRGDGWGEPVNVGPPVNTDSSEFGPTISPEGDLYFVGSNYEDSHGAGDVYVSRFESGRFTAPVNLALPLNTDTHDFSPAFAPDGSYMIFTSLREVMHSRDLKLLASFKKPDGTWSHPVDLGRRINSQSVWHPHVSYNGKYVFYLRGDNYYWFSADVMQDMMSAVVGSEPTADAPVFDKGGQYFAHAATNQIALGDLDGDGDQDAVFSNMAFNDSRVYLNDGTGRLDVTDQLLTQQGHGVDLGDLDGDGDMDIFMTCAGYGENGTEYRRPSRVYLNDGRAHFTDNGQNLGDSLSSGNAVWLHDIDTDGDLDAMILYYREDNGIYLNDGSGQFVRSEQTFPDGSTWGDLDGDGDVDIVVREVGKGFSSLLNDGSGRFSEQWQDSDSTVTRGRTCLVDLNGDHHLDAVVTFGDHMSERRGTVWLGDGQGGFTPTNAALPVTRWGHLAPGDLNSDGHVDLFVSNLGFPSSVWLGDGKGQVIDAGLRLGEGNMNGQCTLADLDGDGDLDAFVAAFGRGPNEIWFNRTGE